MQMSSLFRDETFVYFSKKNVKYLVLNVTAAVAILSQSVEMSGAQV